MEHGYMTADTKVWDYMRYPAFLNNERISNTSKLLERRHPGVGINTRLYVLY